MVVKAADENDKRQSVPSKKSDYHTFSSNDFLIFDYLPFKEGISHQYAYLSIMKKTLFILFSITCALLLTVDCIPDTIEVQEPSQARILHP